MASECTMQKLGRTPDWQTSEIHASKKDKQRVQQVPRVLYQPKCQGFFGLAKHMQILVFKKIGRRAHLEYVT